MKKFFALLAAVLLVLPLGAGALAVINEAGDEILIGTINESTNTFLPQTAEMTVSFDITESYEVIIPASIKLSGTFATGFSGNAKIEADPQLNGRSVIVSLTSGTLKEPKYYRVGTTDSVEASTLMNNDDLSKVVFAPALNGGTGTSTGKTASVELTGDNGLQAFGGSAADGVKVLTATGTDTVTNTLTYTVTGLSGLLSGSYSFPQTFSIAVNR